MVGDVGENKETGWCVSTKKRSIGMFFFRAPDLLWGHMYPGRKIDWEDACKAAVNSTSNNKCLLKSSKNVVTNHPLTRMSLNN